AMPIIATLRALAGRKIISLRAILNGTTNYILTRMEEEATFFEDALGAAQRAGYAEADASMDIDGFDPAYKLAICIATIERRHIRRQRRRDPKDREDRRDGAAADAGDRRLGDLGHDRRADPSRAPCRDGRSRRRADRARRDRPAASEAGGRSPRREGSGRAA